MAFVESVQLVKTLPCLADPGKLIVIGQPSRTIDGILPLVAAVAPNVIAFNPATGTLTLPDSAFSLGSSSASPVPGVSTAFLEKVS